MKFHKPISAEEYITSHWEPHQVHKRLLVDVHQERFDHIAELCVGQSGIDVGCAFGHSTCMLADRTPGMDWAGADFSKTAIEEAEKLLKWTAYFKSPDYLPSFAYDTVVCSEVIEHVEADADLLRNLVRCARRRVIVTTPNVWVNDPGHIRLYTKSGLAALAEHALMGVKSAIHSHGRHFFLVIDKPT